MTAPDDFYAVMEKYMGIRKIFISHISDESELAQDIKQQLDKNFLGLFDIFVSSDLESIKAGEKWLELLEAELKNAELLIVLCSPSSVGRPWVNFEAGAVWLRGIHVIPVCHSGLRACELPIPLSMLEAVEAGQGKGQQKLYAAIAELLGSRVPEVDFGCLAAGFNELEARVLRAQSETQSIVNPRVLCAASAQYAHADYGFQSDIDIVQRAFPENVTVEKQLTSQRLRNLLSSQKFDIAHLVLAVDRQNGDLIFCPVSNEVVADQNAVMNSLDRMSAVAFAALLVESQTKLVVLATFATPCYLPWRWLMWLTWLPAMWI